MFPLKHTCVFCEKVLSSFKKLEEHLRYHTGERPYFCEDCDESFSTKRQLDNHVQKNHVQPSSGSKMVPLNHSCVFCEEEFPSVEKLEEHLRSHTGERPYFCDDCDECFTTNSELDNHIQRNHAQASSAASSEVKMDIKDSMIPCEICSKLLFGQINMIRHMKNYHKVEPSQVYKEAEDNRFPCDICDNTYPTLNSMRKHLRKVHKVEASDVPKFPCEDCAITFSRRAVMLSHMRAVHQHLPNSDLDIFPCDDCHKVFLRRGQLTAHKRKVHNLEPQVEPQVNKEIEDLRVPCAICNKKFLPGTSMNRHMRQGHKVEPTGTKKETEHKRLPCEICERTYANQSTLAKHNKKAHNKIQPTGINKGTEDNGIPCEICEKTFAVRGEMWKHVRSVHDGDTSERPKGERLPCEMCDNTFTTRNRLFKHMKMYHEDKITEITKEFEDKGIPCEICDVTFSRRSYMFKHMRTVHKVEASDVPRFPCEDCAITFSRRALMLSHMRAVHQHLPNSDLDIFPCDHCHQVFIYRHQLSAHIRKVHNLEPQVEPAKDNTKVCQICNETFSCRKDMYRHMRTVHEDVALREPCVICNKKFLIGRGMDMHMLRTHKVGHKKKNAEWHPCEMCDKSFATWHYLQKHVQMAHDAKKDGLKALKPGDSIPCGKCDETFESRLSLILHMKNFHKPTDNKKTKGIIYDCEICGLQTSNWYYLRTHMKAFHLQNLAKPKEKKLVSCQICDKTFTLWDTMKRHMIIKHNVIPKGPPVTQKITKFVPEECTYCGRRFFTYINRKHLKDHVTKCSMKNDFKCEFCGDMFAEKELYKAHLRSFCAKRNIFYKCQLCNSWQNTNPLAILEHAMRCKPSGKKVYKCDLCLYKFPREYVAYHIQWELLHSNLFKDITCDCKCASCKIGLPTQELLRIHQELEHPCLLHMVALDDLDGFTVDPDKKDSLLKERMRIRDLDRKELEFQGKTPKHRCHVCMYPFHSHKVRDFHAEMICEKKFGVTKIQQVDLQPRLSGKDLLDYLECHSSDTRQNFLHYKLTPTFTNTLYNTLINDMKFRPELVKDPEYCDKTEGQRGLNIAKGMLRNWIPIILRSDPVAKAFFEKNLFNEDIAVIEVVNKAPPVLIDISDGIDIPPCHPPSLKCMSCFKVCTTPHEFWFHKDTMTRYINRKENAKDNCEKRMLRFKKKYEQIEIPKETNNYNDLSLWTFKGKVPQYFCTNCRHPFISRKVRDFHQEICDRIYFAVEETLETQEEHEQEVFVVTASPKKTSPTLCLVKCD